MTFWHGLAALSFVHDGLLVRLAIETPDFADGEASEAQPGQIREHQTIGRHVHRLERYGCDGGNAEEGNQFDFSLKAKCICKIRLCKRWDCFFFLRLM